MNQEQLKSFAKKHGIEYAPKKVIIKEKNSFPMVEVWMLILGVVALVKLYNIWF